MEYAASLAAVVLVLFSAQIGMKTGARVALSRMLIIVLGVFVAMRHWYAASRWAGTYESASVAIIAIIVFWVLFLATGFVLMKLSDTYFETFESVHPSIIGRLLGTVFGLVSGAAFAAALMMTLSIAAPTFLTAYKRAALPLPVDDLPAKIFRLVETRIAGVGANDPGHTPLPRLESAGEQEPAKFWQ